MRVFDFSAENADRVDAHGSRGASFSRIYPRSPGASDLYFGCMYLEPGGRLGRHPAAGDQWFLIIQGGGTVQGEDGPLRVGPGSAVFWGAGEPHETRAGRHGLTALVVEGTQLAPVEEQLDI